MLEMAEKEYKLKMEIFSIKKVCVVIKKRKLEGKCICNIKWKLYLNRNCEFFIYCIFLINKVYVKIIMI